MNLTQSGNLVHIFVGIFFSAIAGSLWAQGNQGQSEATAELCLIAGEGVTLRSGSSMLLMDGLFREGFPEDKLPSAALMSKIENAESPYDMVDLVTVSHNHIDHFGIDSIAKFLHNNESASLLLPPEAADEFTSAGHQQLAGRILPVYPQRGSSQMVSVAGIELEIFNLDHASEVENIGIFFELAGSTFFHMGDFMAADLASNGIAGLQVDYLLLPYWYLRTEENFQLIESNMEVGQYIPIHLPAADLPEDFAERVGGFDKLLSDVRGRTENVILLYQEEECLELGEG